MVLAWEDGAPQQHLGKNAAHGPYVDRRIVVAIGHEFRGAVPERHHELCERGWSTVLVHGFLTGTLAVNPIRERLAGAHKPSQAKVADF